MDRCVSLIIVFRCSALSDVFKDIRTKRLKFKIICPAQLTFIKLHNTMKT